MTKMFCDRCKKESGPLHIFPLDTLVDSSTDGNFKYDIIKKDLCYECFKLWAFRNSGFFKGFDD